MMCDPILTLYWTAVDGITVRESKVKLDLFKMCCTVNSVKHM